MKHVLGGVAIAALLAAGLSAHAQTSGTDQQKQAPSGTTQNAPGSQGMKSSPADTRGSSSANKSGTSADTGTSASGAQSGATTPSDTTGQTGAGKAKTGKSKQAMTKRGARSPEDNMAEELNRRELENVMRNAGQAPSSGASQGSSTPSTAPPKQ